jgi:hypothetical protein
MLRTLGKTCGGGIAMMCLLFTLAMAQYQSPSQSQTQKPPQSQTMTCAKDDGKGNCTAATRADGQIVVVVGEDLQTGEKMTCVDTGTMINCTKLVVK